MCYELRLAVDVVVRHAHGTGPKIADKQENHILVEEQEKVKRKLRNTNTTRHFDVGNCQLQPTLN